MAWNWMDVVGKEGDVITAMEALRSMTESEERKKA